MALRSVVLASPPGAGAPRRTVVLRPGGPKDKGRAADLVAAIIGAILLLVAIVLVAVLPVKEYATPQFRVTFQDKVADNVPSQGFDFLESPESSRVHEFKYDLPDEVQSIHLVADFVDDNNASLPDQFRIELYDQDGNPASIKYDLLNPPPVNHADPTNPQTMANPIEGFRAKGDYIIAVAAHPSEEIVPGLSHTEVQEQVQARLASKYHIPSQGTWTVRVTLVAANDCPAPGPDSDSFRIAMCRNQAQDGNDPGNDFTLNFIYTTISAMVQELGK